MRLLTPDEARAFYDRFGRKQDSQAFYEDRAVELLVSRGAFECAERVFELGCGTGRMARMLLDHHLPEHAAYYASDLSTTMVRLTSSRLRPFAGRALVVQLSAGARLPLEDSSVDRFLSTYLFDLLDERTISSVLREAHRVLTARGRLCLVGITPGRNVLSRMVMSGWSLLHRLSPRLVGGCRPMEVLPLLPSRQWQVDSHAVVTGFGIASEVLVASGVEASDVG